MSTDSVQSSSGVSSTGSLHLSVGSSLNEAQPWEEHEQKQQQLPQLQTPGNSELSLGSLLAFNHLFFQM